MLKKTISYVDFNGVPRKEDFYFNLTKAEVAEMELSIDGGFGKLLEGVVEVTDSGTPDEKVEIKDRKRLLDTFKDLILRSYGEKSLDGKRFIKTQEVREAFEQSEAYSELFMELLTNDQMAAAFVNGIIPSVPNK
jgi:hypothetical protein